MRRYSYLVVIETQRVKSYLFASRFLRETRGASFLLDRLNRRDTASLVRQWHGEEVYLGGGSGRILFDRKDDAQGFARDVREWYRRHARDARVSVELVSRQPGEGFFDWMARGVAASRQSKRAQLDAVPLIGGRWIRPCTSCGQRAAERVPVRDAPGEHRLCISCFQKRQEVEQLYREKGSLDRGIPIPRLEWLRTNRSGFVLTTLAERIEAQFPGHRVLLPQDFEDIGELGRPSHYFAFLYADGNRMGEVLRSLSRDIAEDVEAVKAYRVFSEVVDQATREAAVEAVLSEVGSIGMKTARGEQARLVPAELVIAGGDDLILVVPAQAGLAVASRFLSEFQARSRELQAARLGEGGELEKNGFTSSAGVVLSHDSYPASQLVDLAAELMKLAKRRAADLAESVPAGARIEGTVDFAVLHEPGSERIKQRRWTEYIQPLPSGRSARLTERPYTGSDLERLCECIQALKSSTVPRSKLKALYSILFRSPLEAQFEGLRIQERLKATGDLGTSGPLFELISELDRFPFRQSGEDWSTPLSEIIEIFDFVPEKQVGELADD
jgi:hypothetical protein